MTLYSGKRIADMSTEEIRAEIRNLRNARTIASSASRRATAEKRRSRETREPDLSALADLPPGLREEVMKALSLGGSKDGGSSPAAVGVGGEDSPPSSEESSSTEGEGISPEEVPPTH